MPKPWQKFSLGLLAVLLAATSLAGTLLIPAPAQAQGLPAFITGSIPDTTNKIINQIYAGLKAAVLTATSRVVAYALRKFAYDSAVWLAAGGKGQSPLAFTKGFGDYLKQVGDDALGAGIEQLGSAFGVENICQIPDVKVNLALRIGLRTGFEDVPGAEPGSPLKGKCSFSQFTSEWFSGDAWRSKYSEESLAERFSANLELSQTDFGIHLKTTQKIDQLIRNKVAGADKQREEGKGFLAKTTLISNQITNPAALIQKGFENIIPSKQGESDEEQVRALLTSGEIRVIPNVLGIFLNTLVSTMVKNYQEKGILPFGSGCRDGSQNCLGAGAAAQQFEAGGAVGGRRAAQELFSSFLAVELGAKESYDLIAELGNCEGSGTYNCRADNDLLLALQNAAGGETVTVASALARGWLHADRKLIPGSRVTENADLKQFCQNAYCYSNIKVLRQARILPLGFEIAAANSNPDRPWILGDVVKGFNDCDFIRNPAGEITGVRPDPARFPYCHLIDPDWVIKAPPARCNALGPGALHLGRDVPTRLTECADLSTCVAYAPDNKTCATFAYCAREKNAWKFNADTCRAENRTCQTYQSGGKEVSYLSRTLDTRSCSEAAVGCRAYSLRQDASGKWQLPSTPDAALGFASDAVYFNAKLPAASTCGARSAGCTAFVAAADPAGDLLNLRKAPDYLGCYDADRTAPGIQWPENPADLNRLAAGAPAACGQYAPACIPDEVGCAVYTAKETGERIPGKVVSGDRCEAQCVGYDAYRETESDYSAGEPLAYLIPDLAKECRAEEKGCRAFTNVSEGRAEQVEYFTRLRPCQLPDPATPKTKEKNFTVFEGTAQAGFQLRVYTLATDGSGGPKYFYRTLEELAGFEQKCTAALYQAGQADADCRQFNDDQGRVYYRLLAQTIPVSNSCTDYRLDAPELYTALVSGAATQAACTLRHGRWNNGRCEFGAAECAAESGKWELASGRCELCYSGGEYRDGFCYYRGLPGGVLTNAGASASCSAAAESCREYKGPRGNRVRQIFTDTFEGVTTTADLPAWSAPAGATNYALSSESTHANEQSLTVSGAGGVLIRRLTDSEALRLGESYTLTFWAKGSGGNLSVRLVDADGNFDTTLESRGLGDAWQYYRYGPVIFTGATTSAYLFFNPASPGQFFIDNVQLTEVSDYLYRLKNSLTIPAACDSHPEDNLPGEALGCRAYTAADGRSENLTNFSFLCREAAIGCTAVLDTYNTLTGGRVTEADQGPQVYRVWLPGNGPGTLKLTINGRDLAAPDGRTPVTCAVPAGEPGCYVDVRDVEPGILTAQGEINGAAVRPQLTPSSVYLPADTPSTTPWYLVNNQETICREPDRGCTAAGALVPAAAGTQFEDTLIKNDPALYREALCQSEAVGCSALLDARGGTTYAKDPAVQGNRICAYRPAVPDKGIRAGWYWSGVKVCDNDATKICASDAACGAGNKCNQDRACYPNYTLADGSYGLWSAGDVNTYAGFVGECPAAEAGCSEFVDRNDNNRPWYFLNNDKVNKNDCSGEVSLKNGCALFDETANPAKLWNTAASYRKSDRNDGRLVPPEPASNKNDANIIIKVAPDRECGEWLQCRSSHRVWDQTTSRWREVCDEVGRCNTAAPATEPGDLTNCGNWVENKGATPALTVADYVKRGVGWRNQEYSGYSLLGLPPPEELWQMNIAPPSAPADWRLVRRVPTTAGPAVYSCNPDGAPCGADGSGVCTNGVCIAPARDNTAAAERLTCRAYPEEDAPFPNTLSLVDAPLFNGVKRCQESGPSAAGPTALACECDYTRVQYGDLTTKFWNYRAPNSANPLPRAGATLPGPKGVPPALCEGGTQAGKVCATNADCAPRPGATPDGTCQRLTREDKRIGWRGYCLEYDQSRPLNNDPKTHPCLTWWPVDTLQGALDINNQHAEAGYQNPERGGTFYCLNSSGGADAQGGHSFVTRPHLSISTNQFAVNPLPPDSSTEEAKIIQTDIEKITFQVVSSGPEDPAPGTIFEIWPNDPATQQASYKVKPKNKEDGDWQLGYAVAGRFLGQSHQLVLMYGSQLVQGNTADTYVKEDGQVCFPLAGGRCGDLSGNIFTRIIGDPWQSSSCPGANRGNGNWHAIKVRFDLETRAFLGYDFSFCDDSPDSGGIDYKVTFHLREWCRAIAEAKVDYAAPETAPWTNRLWNKLRQFPIQALRFTSSAGKTNLNYNVNTPFSPFGSLDANSPEGLASPVILTPFSLPSEAGQVGRPCSGLVERTNLPATCRCPSGGLEECRYWILDPQASIGAPYSCADAAGSRICTRSEEQQGKLVTVKTAAGEYLAPEGRNNLGQIFAAVKRIFRFDLTPASTASGYTGYQVTDERIATAGSLFADFVYDYTATGDLHDGNTVGVAPQRPQLWAPFRCDAADDCFEGPTSRDVFTVNGVTSTAKISGAANRTAVLRFFGAADSNQMPLRGVAVDWGDGRVIRYAGQYRNQRGKIEDICRQGARVCQGDPAVNGRTCSADADCQGQLQHYQCSIRETEGRCRDDRSIACTASDNSDCPFFDNDSNRPRTPCSVPSTKYCDINGQKGDVCTTDQACPPLPNQPTPTCSSGLRCTVGGQSCTQLNGSCGPARWCVEAGQAPTFDRQEGATCDNAFFQFEHVYQCAADAGNLNWLPNDSRCRAAGLPGGCCIYRPRVQLTDNWGWCNGNCGRTDSAGRNLGCYREECQDNSPTSGAWTTFQGNVIVAPSQ
ncbi:MAG: hypothetical protein HYV42_02205 [Candidatus Magasanikbacteria bacterium]|nr:hypothetical protein [Candidatus Magasanikbacteria bacterium]